MKQGDVILVPLPQADGQRKLRPGIILKILPPFGDFLVCGVGSQLRHQVRGLDELLLRGDKDFNASGLQNNSLIRAAYLAMYAPHQIPGSIGEISVERHARLLKQLAEFFMSST